jgi:hypothetical protein
MKSIGFSLSFFFLSCWTFAQPFHRLVGGTTGDERGQTALMGLHGRYLLNGATTSFGQGSADAMLSALDAAGNIVWSRVYGTAGYDNSEYAIVTADGGIVGTGRLNVTGGNEDALVFKTDSLGHLLWSKAYGGAFADGFAYAAEAGNGDLLFVGATLSSPGTQNSLFLMRTDANGDTVFTRVFDTGSRDIGLCVAETADSGLVVAGKLVYNNWAGLEQSNALVMKTDRNGNLLWSRMYGDSLWEELASIEPLPDGGFIAAGTSVGYGPGRYEYWLLRLDSVGDVVWSKTYGGIGDEAAYTVLVDDDGGFVLSGYSNSLGYGHRTAGDDAMNVVLIKTDANGDTLWCRSYGDGLQDEAYRSSKAADGGFLISGFTTSYTPANLSQMLMIHTDSQGWTGCHEQAIQPVVTVASYVPTDTALNVYSGMTVSNPGYVEASVAPVSDDACLILGTGGPAERPAARLYPNPATQEVVVEDPYAEAGETLLLFDLAGRLLLQERFVDGRVRLSLDGLTAGCYLLRSGAWSLKLMKN